MVLPNNTFKLFFPIFFLSFGLALILFFGPVKLSCTRLHPNQVNCSLVRSVAFGSIERDKIVLEPLKLAKLDTKIKRTIESTESGGGSVIETPVYGVVLVSDRDVLWEGSYDYSPKHSQAIVDQINYFLADANQTQLVLADRNYTLDILTLMILSLSGMLFFKSI